MKSEFSMLAEGVLGGDLADSSESSCQSSKSCRLFMRFRHQAKGVRLRIILRVPTK